MLGTTCNGLWKGNRNLFKKSNELLLSITGRNLSDYLTKHSYQLLKKDYARRSLLFAYSRK